MGRLFENKKGLITGVFNKQSIAWAIAQVTALRGARLALTYQGRFEEHVHELSQGLESPLILPCDVSSDSDIESVFARVDATNCRSRFRCRRVTASVWHSTSRRIR